MTVVRAKALRLRPTDKQINETKSEEKIVEEEAPIPPQQQNTFTLPDSAQKINELVTIIQTHKGDQEITISDKKFSLNSE